MLSLNISTMLKVRGHLKPYAWLRAHGFPDGAARKLANGTFSTVPLHHIERLCLLLGCTPNDLLTYTPADGAPPDAPLNALKAASGLEWVAGLEKLTVDELRELGKKVAAVSGKEEEGKG